MGLLLKLLTTGGVLGGVGAGAVGLTAAAFPRIMAGAFEILAGVLDVTGYIFFIAFILGWKAGGEKLAIIWPLSMVLEVVAHELWVF